MLILIVGVVFLAAYVVSRSRDARLLRNGVFLAAAVVFGGLGVLTVAADTSPLARIALGLLALALPLSVVVFGVLLIANGVTMLRKEGRSLGNQLSLLVGILVFVFPVVAVLVSVWFGTVGLTIAALIALLSAYASAAFLSFAVYSVIYGRMRHRARPDAIVVHGAGLLPDGTVTPLLRGRLDRALRVHQEAVAQGRRPLLVPSGGQGADELRPEAVAMAEYLEQRGVPAEDVLCEDRSTTTRENIQRSTELLRERGHHGPVLLVTSDYHVLRTASLARRLGSDAHVVGSRTARYYVPSAFLREFVALLVEHRWVSVIALGPFVVIAVAIIVGELTAVLR